MSPITSGGLILILDEYITPYFIARQLSRVICEAILELDPDLLVYFPAPLSQAFPRIAKEVGLRVIGEINADTEYTPDGAVVVQREKHILDPEVARKKIRKFITEGTVTAINGEDIKLE